MVKEKRAFTYYSVYIYIENSMYHLNDLQRNIFLKKASHFEDSDGMLLQGLEYAAIFYFKFIYVTFD